MITDESKKILLADDSIFFRTKLSAILLEAGHRVRFASDGRDVIMEVQIDPKGLDLLVLDLQMPNIDGFGVLEWLNEKGYRDKLPVLVITGVYEPGEVIERLRQLGAKGLMSKGFTPEQVLHRVNMLLFPEKRTDRQKDRVPVSMPVDFTVGERTSTGFLLNISVGGLFLHTRQELLNGAALKMKFSLPGSEKIINAKGAVRWTTASGATTSLFGGAGVMFTEISAEDLAIVRMFVETELKKINLEEI